MRHAFALTSLFTLATLLAGCATPPPATAPTAATAATVTAPVRVKVLAINDFHGNLKPPAGGIRVRDAARQAHRGVGRRCRAPGHRRGRSCAERTPTTSSWLRAT
jgi:2',3'-cyclic-nucleotide 2'-phosphodiesterase (5'-nucleotidase family)